jgi:hypothetical protein
VVTVQKDFRGSWRARTEYELADNKILQIRTSKNSNGAIATYATVQFVEGEYVTHRAFKDFKQCIATTSNRCTSRNVAEQHTRALGKLDEIKQAVTAWYQKLVP